MQNNIFRGITLGLLCLLLSNCAVKKQMQTDTDEVMIDQLNQLVECLNERKLSCLKELYSTNYNSLAPIVEIPSIDEFIQLTVESMTENDYLVAAEITELEIGIQYAYVRLNWKLVEPAGADKYNLVVDEKRLDIWRKEGGQWRLYRSLFYKEFAY